MSALPAPARNVRGEPARAQPAAPWPRGLPGSAPRQLAAGVLLVWATSAVGAPASDEPPPLRTATNPPAVAGASMEQARAEYELRRAHAHARLQARDHFRVCDVLVRWMRLGGW